MGVLVLYGIQYRRLTVNQITRMLNPNICFTHLWFHYVSQIISDIVGPAL